MLTAIRAAKIAVTSIVLAALGLIAAMQYSATGSLERLEKSNSAAASIQGKKEEASVHAVALEETVKAPLVPAWQVSIYASPAPGDFITAPFDALAASNNLAGVFLLSGDWLSMNEHQRHEDIYLGEQAVFRMKGLIEALRSGQFVFAAHWRIENRAGTSTYGRITCYSQIEVADQPAGEGTLLADKNEARASFHGDQAVQLKAGFLYPVVASFLCDVPANINRRDVMVRVMVREPGRADYIPVQVQSPYS